VVDAARQLLLRVMRVPAEPHPPAGAPGTLQVFRAGRNFFKLKLAGWGLSQLLAFAGIVFWVWIFVDLEGAAYDIKENRARRERASATSTPPSAPATPTQPPTANASPTQTETGKTTRKAQANRRRRSSGETFTEWKTSVAMMLARFPGWAFLLVWLVKIVGLLTYLVQLPLTYAIARFDYEMRWYLVTDRSLRIRHGILKLEELTMSFVNIQHVVVTQGPLQRLLGLADVRVQSAGGGSTDHHGKGTGDTMHTAVFHAVENAEEIRDLILDRLRSFRAAGLGDPDDHHTPVGLAAHDATAASGGDALAAARELLDEARKLRALV
jgi:membrane protein YdbS with pleckstrin-like domain